jgi:hypothetical protein
MLGVAAIREEQCDNRGKREERQRSVDQTARIYFNPKHFRVTRNSQHSRAAVALKRKLHFGRINFRRAGVDSALSRQYRNRKSAKL